MSSRSTMQRGCLTGTRVTVRIAPPSGAILSPVHIRADDREVVHLTGVTRKRASTVRLPHRGRVSVSGETTGGRRFAIERDYRPLRAGADRRAPAPRAAAAARVRQRRRRGRRLGVRLLARRRREVQVGRQRHVRRARDRQRGDDEARGERERAAGRRRREVLAVEVEQLEHAAQTSACGASSPTAHDSRARSSDSVGSPPPNARPIAGDQVRDDAVEQRMQRRAPTAPGASPTHSGSSPATSRAICPPMIERSASSQTPACSAQRACDHAASIGSPYGESLAHTICDGATSENSAIRSAGFHHAVSMKTFGCSGSTCHSHARSEIAACARMSRASGNSADSSTVSRPARGSRGPRG